MSPAVYSLTCLHFSHRKVIDARCIFSSWWGQKPAPSGPCCIPPRGRLKSRANAQSIASAKRVRRFSGKLIDALDKWLTSRGISRPGHVTRLEAKPSPANLTSTRHSGDPRSGDILRGFMSILSYYSQDKGMVMVPLLIRAHDLFFEYACLPFPMSASECISCYPRIWRPPQVALHTQNKSGINSLLGIGKSFNFHRASK